MKHNAFQFPLGLSATIGRPKNAIRVSNRIKKSKRAAHVRIANPRAVNLDLLTPEMKEWFLGKLGVK